MVRLSAWMVRLAPAPCQPVAALGRSPGKPDATHKSRVRVSLGPTMRRMSEEAANNEGVFPLAVGCLPIVPKPGSGSDEESFFQSTDKRWWKEQLEQGLGLLSSVTDLVVEINDVSFRANSDIDILDEYEPRYDTDYDPSPDYYSFVRFTLTIPKRMHRDIFRSTGRSVNCERFRVSTIYGSRGPVTIVGSEDTQGWEGKPSQYIFLVREFLIRELDRVDASLEVKTVGPSPFWGDMHLVPRKGLGEDILVKWKKSRFTYAEIQFLYDPDHISDLVPVQRVVRQIVEPFSTYYYVVRSWERRLRRANIVARLTDKLIAAHQRKGIRGFLAKIVRSGGTARELLVAAITAKQLDMEESARVAGDVRETQPADGIPALEIPELIELCEAEANTKYSDRLTMAQEVANALEGSRMNQYQVLVLAGCTLVGAVVGAAGALIAAAMAAP
jgi:hypothetical protein